MESYIGSGLILIASILTHDYVKEYPILETASANDTLAVAMALTGFAFAVLILLEGE